MSPTSSATWLMPTSRAVMAGIVRTLRTGLMRTSVRPPRLVRAWRTSRRSWSRAPGSTTSRTSPRAAARRAGGHHRPVRIGQVVAGVRHDLRRGPAPLRRVAQRLRAAVPRADGQAGRRLDRGPVAGDLDRSEDDVAQPALDGRHGHRDLRLPAPAVGARGQAALPHLRRADRGRSPSSRSSTRSWTLPEGRRFMVLAPIVRGRKGEYGKLFEELRGEGFARVGRRRAADARGGDRARQEATSTTSRSSSTGSSCGPTCASASPTRSRRRSAWPTGSSRSRRCRATATARRHHALLRALRLPALRHVDARARAADLLVQLAARRVHALHRPGHADGDRPGARRPGPGPVDQRGRAPAVGEQRVELLRAAHRRRSPRPTASTSTRRGASCPRTSATCSCTAPTASG